MCTQHTKKRKHSTGDRKQRVETETWRGRGWGVVDELCSLCGELESATGDVKHITQGRAELEISYAGCKVIVCIEGNRRPLCLRIRRAVGSPHGIWSWCSMQHAAQCFTG